MGPKAFLQGLFGLGGGSRDDHAVGRGSSGGQPSEPAHPVPSPPVLPPPQQPLPVPPAATSSGGADSNLLATLAKGIEALLVQQQSTKSDKPETVKPGINELPALPEYQPSTGSIDLLHWITHIGPIMEDLSDTSSTWWQTTMKDALRWYERYSSAAPLARLQLTPQPSSELLRPEWARVERRATAMMLSAVPRGVREEVIAHGQVSSLSLLCKLYAVYNLGTCRRRPWCLRCWSSRRNVPLLWRQWRGYDDGACGEKGRCRLEWLSRTRRSF